MKCSSHTEITPGCRTCRYVDEADIDAVIDVVDAAIEETLGDSDKPAFLVKLTLRHNGKKQFACIKFNDRYYRVLSKKEVALIGSGGYGQIKLLQDIESGEYWVRKKIPIDHHYDTAQKCIDSLRNEINILKTLYPYLSWPNTNDINFDVKKDKFRNQYLSYVMPYIEGITLAKFNERQLDPKTKTTKLPTDRKQLRQLAIAILLACQDLENNNVLHLDIKSDNIIINHLRKDDIPIAHLIDFGLAILVQRSDLSEPLEGNYILCGTEGYHAPELLTRRNIFSDNYHDYSPTTTAYSVGITLLGLFDWRVVDSKIDGQMVKGIPIHEIIEKAFRPEEYELKKIIQNLLAPDPNQRTTASRALRRMMALYPTDYQLVLEKRTSTLKAIKISAETNAKKVIERRQAVQAKRMTNTCRSYLQQLGDIIEREANSYAYQSQYIKLTGLMLDGQQWNTNDNENIGQLDIARLAKDITHKKGKVADNAKSHLSAELVSASKHYVQILKIYENSTAERLQDAASLYKQYYGKHTVEEEQAYPSLIQILNNFKKKAQKTLFETADTILNVCTLGTIGFFSPTYKRMTAREKFEEKMDKILKVS